jgi:SAM-dependent methyltransferase
VRLIATGVVVAAALGGSGCGSSKAAPAARTAPDSQWTAFARGLPADSFPPPSRRFSEIVAPRWTDETSRDATNEAETVMRALGVRPGMRVADVAAGRGRHALLLAAAGFLVTAFDRDAAAMARVRDLAARCDWSLTTEVRDLEAEGADLGDAAFDAIVVTHYLHRPLFPAIVRALAPGGVLLYETFTTAQALRGKPTNPAFLLEPGELPRLVAPLEVLRAREGDVDGRMVASVVARKADASAPEPA